MSTVAPLYEKGRLYTMDLSQLQPDLNQPRKSLDPAALEELAASIAQHGVLEPILFRLNENGGLIIVAGERRVQAARQANLTTIPGILVDGNHAEIARKKQTRSMLTAYNKYKEQAKKQQEGRKKPKATTSSPEDVLDWMEKTGKKLSAIDTTNYTGEQKAALAEALAGLQATIESLLHSQAPAENQPV